MSATGRVAVVIVNFNGMPHLADCLGSVRSQTFSDLSIAVLDNGSTDGSSALIRESYPEVELVECDENLGFAAGNNLLIEQCLLRDGVEYVLTLNNDVILDDDCVERLVSLMDSSPATWSCQPKMYLFGEGGARVFNNAGIIPWRDGSAYNRGINEEDSGQYDGAAEVFGTCAGCSLYRASALRRTGLFDESFFAYMEDVDLAWRGRLAGFSSALCIDAVCRHRHGASATAAARKIALVEANRIRVLVKNYALIDILISPLFTAWRYARLATAAGGGASPGSRLDAYSSGLTAGDMVGALARGWLNGLRSVPSMLRARGESKQKGRIPAREIRDLLRRFSAPLGRLLSG
jgi:GT2 family glycosyltransferase